MGDALALAVYAVLIGAASLVVWRRPVAALYLCVVGLALHNTVMAGLYGLGVRGSALTAIQAWKEILLAVAGARVLREAVRARRLPFRPGLPDALALAFGALVLLYALLPQGSLGGEAGTKAVLYGVRHDLVPVAAYLLGRSLALGREDLRRLAWTLLGAAAGVAAFGFVEIYAISLDAWARFGVVDYFHNQLGYPYHGPRGLPENFVYNTGNELRLVRRLVSTFLTPLGTAFMLVVALLFAVAAEPVRRRPWVSIPLAAVTSAGLLFTFSRSSLLALAGGLAVLAAVRRSVWIAGAATATVAVTLVWVPVFPSLAPRAHWSRADLAYQREHAREHPGASGSPVSANEPSLHSHLTSLRAGLRTVVHHAQGFGLGNAGQSALRTHTKLEAGESTYTELGVETGLLGMLLFIAWNLALLVRLLRPPGGGWPRAATGAALAAVLALAIQTDVIGVPWIAICVWWLGGSLLAPMPARVPSPVPSATRPRAVTVERA